MKRDIKNMNPEELKQYNNEKKTRQRDREKLERAAKHIPNVDEYEMPQTQQQRLSEHVNLVVQSIQSETTVTDRDHWIIDSVARVLFGLDNDIKRKVYDPNGSIGMLVGGSFPDAVWSIAIDHVHRFPAILKSATFAGLYKKFLREVTKWSRNNFKFVSADLLDILNQENAGNYRTPVRPEGPKPPAPIESSEDTPSDDEIRRVGGEQLLRQLNIPNEARQYLEQLTWRNQ